MNVEVKPLRSDGKLPLVSRFATGRTVRSLLPSREAGSLAEFMRKYPRASYFGNGPAIQAARVELAGVLADGAAP